MAKSYELYGFTPFEDGLAIWGFYSYNEPKPGHRTERQVFTDAQIKHLMSRPEEAKRILTPYAYRRLSIYR